MFRSKTSVGLALLGAMMVGGCASDHYDPNATDPQLSSYAARTPYPSLSPDRLPDVIYNVGDNGVITISNASDRGLLRFDLWVNKSFVINVVKGLPAHNSITIAPETLYNNTGSSLKSIDPSSIRQVEIATDGKLFQLAGPVKPMPQ